MVERDEVGGVEEDDAVGAFIRDCKGLKGYKQTWKMSIASRVSSVVKHHAVHVVLLYSKP